MCELCTALPCFSLPGGPLSPLPSPGAALACLHAEVAGGALCSPSSTAASCGGAPLSRAGEGASPTAACMPGGAGNAQLNRWMRALLTGFLLSNSPDFRARKGTWLRMLKDPRTRGVSLKLLQHRLACKVGPAAELSPPPTVGQRHRYDQPAPFGDAICPVNRAAGSGRQPTPCLVLPCRRMPPASCAALRWQPSAAGAPAARPDPTRPQTPLQKAGPPRQSTCTCASLAGGWAARCRQRHEA